MKKNNSPILVTGSHRSGTTWIGKCLSASGETAYISEPLNVHHRRGVFHAEVAHWYEYISTQNEAQYLSAFEKTLGLRYQLPAEMMSIKSAKDFVRMMRDMQTFAQGKIKNARPLLKDPFAVFSVPWFVERLGCAAVVSVRHPAAFVSSLKKLGWDFDLQDLLDQPALMKDKLSRWEKDIRGMAQNPDDKIGAAAVLWNAIYDVVWNERNTSSVHVVKHETLSINPLMEFEKLYNGLGLSFNERAKKFILESSAAENPVELSKQTVHAVKLNSAENVHNWEHRISAEEAKRVRDITAPVASLFYPEESW